MRALLAPLVALTMVLAGCLHATDDAVDASTIPDAGNTSAPLPVKLPENRTGEFNAFKETNVTTGGLHNHDYWNGATRVTILDEDVGFYTFLADANGAYSDIFLPTGKLVYEGTERVEVTISDVRVDFGDPGIPPVPPLAAAHPAPPAITLKYRHASSASDAWEDAGAAALDTPVVVSIKEPTWTDMPHSTGSLWAFQLYQPGKADFVNSVRVKIDVVRGAGEIVKWPGHPDFYANGHYRIVYDGEAETDEFAARAIANLGPSVATKSTPGRLVSYGTKTLLVFLNVTAVDAQVKPTHWALEFHNASSPAWNLTDPWDSNYTSDKGTYAWTLRVDPNGMDSPYAPDSRWEFRLRGAWSTPDTVPMTGVDEWSFYGGWAPYKVTYTMTVIATDLEAPLYSRTFG